MGLLDIDMSTPEGQGFNSALMQAAAMLLTPRARGGGLGSAFAAMPQAIDRAKAQAQRSQLMDMQAQQLGMQGKKLGFEMDEAQRKARQQQAAQESFARMVASLPEDQRAVAEMVGPSYFEPKTLSPGSSLVSGGRTLNQAPFKPETPPELTRLLQARDSLPEGHPYRAIYDQQINRMTTHAPGTTVNVGTGQKDSMWGEPPKNHVWARDPATGQVMTQADSSGAVAPVALPIAGSKEATERAEAGRKLGERAKYARDTQSIVLQTVREAKAKVGWTTAGMGGAIMGNFPGSGAVDLQGLVDTVKANIGFDRLQKMREMSPTGGALGQVAVQELAMLQAVIASLDRNQSPDQLRANLDKIERHMTNWAKAVADAEGGGSSGASGGWSIQKVQ